MQIDIRNLEINDERKPSDKIFSGGKISVCYTLKTDDITKGPKPWSTPFVDRTGEFVYDGALVNEESGTTLSVESYRDGLKFVAEKTNNDLSEWGLNFPFNFMGKLNGGDYKDQFLFNSPYITPDRDYMSFYLTKPNGGNVLLAVKSGGVGWKMDYSPYQGGHFFLNLKVFGSFDKAYGAGGGSNRMEIILLPVKDYFDALETLSQIFSVPFIYPVISNGKIGDSTKIRIFGKADTIVEKHGDKEREIKGDFIFSAEGESLLIPYYNGKKGATATVYGYSSLVELYKKSLDAVDLSEVAKTDGNLCEHQCWASATLRFLSNYKCMLTPKEVKTYESRVLSLLAVVTEKDPLKAVPRRTILQPAFRNFPAYNIFLSRRIQEQFFGITLLLDAYKYFGDEEYLTYAIGATDCLIDNYQAADGRLETNHLGDKEDYTTVCCPMIPLVDMANFLRNIRPELSSKYACAAGKMAEYLYNRGLKFPTEGATSTTYSEMEDGSISCTALSLLYYCKNLSENELYLQKSKEILDLHDNWVIKTPVCQMENSSLRWWETQWEGDGDGPAICCGHAWTIWRAEADYLYYVLTSDEKYLIKAKNGFGTNFAKIRPDGVSYSIYNVDDINGGGFHSRSDDVIFKIASKFASVTDSGISRYVWIRTNDTLLKTGDNK